MNSKKLIENVTNYVSEMFEIHLTEKKVNRLREINNLISEV